MFKPNDHVFVDNLPLRLFADSIAEAMSKQVYKKLQPQTARPFWIIKIQVMTLTIDVRGTPQTVLVDHVTHEPETTSINHNSHEKTSKQNFIEIGV